MTTSTSNVPVLSNGLSLSVTLAVSVLVPGNPNSTANPVIVSVSSLEENSLSTLFAVPS